MVVCPRSRRSRVVSSVHSIFLSAQQSLERSAMENFSALRIHRDRTVGLGELPEILGRLLGPELWGRTVVRLAGDVP